MSWEKRPVRLNAPQPRKMSPEAMERCRSALEAGCNCGSETAMLVRRPANGGWAVALQCTGCGRSIGGAMSRASHFEWPSYPVWDQALVDRTDAEYRAKAEEHAERMRLAAEARAQATVDRANYRQWCRTSPDWHSLSDRVHRRDRDLCQGCLVAPSSVVHHLTYEFGRLPPAWHLIAVCDGCHDRIHADKHGRDDDWCPA